MMKRGALVAVIVALTIGASAPANAESGWIKSKGAWVQWKFHFRPPAGLEGRGLMILHEAQKAQAIQRAQRHRAAHVRKLRALLRKAQAVLTLARSIIGQGVWGCVARWEEGGRNSVAGYFGTIYPPSSYPEPGPTYARQYGNSWLSIPYSAQLQVAQAIQARYGWSAWGPHTRAMCGL